MQPLPPQPQYPAQPQPSWWSRNWKWAAPVGCLVLLLPILAIGGFIGGIVAIVFGSIKSTDVAQEALQRAISSPVVIEALGAPVEDGWWVAGQIKTTGPSGYADIMIPLKGSRTQGKLYAVARKSAGRWTYETMEVEVDGQDERIDLLAGPE
jgi:hypothetical protein